MKVVKVQKLTLSFGTGDTSKSGTLSGFTTLARCIPFSVSVECDTDTAQIGQVDFDVEVTSTTNVTASRGVSGVACTVIVYVVELDSNSTVQKKTWSLGTGDTSTSATLSTVVMAETFTLFFRKCTTGSTLQPNAANVACALTSTTNVAITKATAGGAHSGHVYSVSNSDLTVQRGSATADSAANAITISTIDLADSFCICSHSSTSTQYEDEGNGHLRLNTTTALEFALGYSSGNATVKWQVVEDTDFTTQRFHTRNTSTASGALTLSTVDTDFVIAMPGAMPGRHASALYDNAGDMNNRCTSYDITTSTNCNWAKYTASGSYAVDIVEFTEAVDPNPTITDVGDEDFTPTETDITVTGTNFKSPQSTGKLELANSSTYAGATKVTQSIDTWADTSIQFDLTLGSLNVESLYLFVTNSDGNTNDTGYAINVNMKPTISNAGDEEFEPDETDITLTGTIFMASQGTGKLEIGDNSVYASATKVTQSIDSWGDTSIQFDLEMGSLDDLDLYLFLTNSLGHVSDGYAVQVLLVPTITDIEDEILDATEKNVELDGTNLGASQGTGKLEMADSNTYATATKVTQTIDSWGKTDITFDVVMGSISQESVYFFVTNDVGEVSTGYAVTMTGLPISDGLWKQASIQGEIKSTGFKATIFLIRDT